MQSRIIAGPEVPRASHLVLPQARLGFMDAERDGLSHGRAVVARLEALFIDAVAAFVQGAEQGGHQIAIAVAMTHPQPSQPVSVRGSGVECDAVLVPGLVLRDREQPRQVIDPGCESGPENARQLNPGF